MLGQVLCPLPKLTFLIRASKVLLAGFLILFAAPLGAHSLIHWSRDAPENWSSADWSSMGVLPAAASHKPAMVRIFAARAGRWRGNFAVHSWIVVKLEGGAYQRFDKVGWGNPMRMNDYPPDGRWFSNSFDTVFAADGDAAQKLIPQILTAIQAYPFTQRSAYTAWPGPNSNTFVACAMARVPQITAALPPTAVGKDFPCDGSWYGRTPSRTGFRVNFGGYGGVMIGWVEGIEINIAGAISGIDIRRPALKLPGFGRIGFAQG